MPVQINEVIIKTVVGAEDATMNANPTPAQSGDEDLNLDLAEKILEIIKEKNER